MNYYSTTRRGTERGFFPTDTDESLKKTDEKHFRRVMCVNGKQRKWFEAETLKHACDRLQSLSVYIAAYFCLHWPDKAVNGIFNYFWHNFEGLRRFPICFRSKSFGNKEHWFKNFMNEKLQFIEKTSQHSKTTLAFETLEKLRLIANACVKSWETRAKKESTWKIKNGSENCFLKIERSVFTIINIYFHKNSYLQVAT